jgi:hypothetical protein
MGNITLAYSGLPNLLPSLNRSPGLHVSDVIHDLAIRRGFYSRDRTKNESSITRMQLGLALEHALAHRFCLAYPDSYIWQPGELIDSDGLPGTPDFIGGHGNLNFAVEDAKLTWKSSTHAPDSDKFITYWWQLKWYCLKMRQRRARLHLCHVRGDYRSFDVHYNVWEQKFSDLELEKNRTMLLLHRDRMMKGDSAHHTTISEEIYGG